MTENAQTDNREHEKSNMKKFYRRPASTIFNEVEKAEIVKELYLAKRFKGSPLTSDEKRKVKKIVKHRLLLQREERKNAAPDAAERQKRSD